MPTNYIQPGDIVTVTAPSDLQVNAAVWINDGFGVALHAALTGEPVAIQRTGRVRLPKTIPQTWGAHRMLSWSNGAQSVQSGTASKIVGVAAAYAESADTVGEVLLMPKVETP